MKIVVTLFLLSGVTMLLLACTQVSTDASENGNVEPAIQPDDMKLVFSSLELNQTNRGSIDNIVILDSKKRVTTIFISLTL